MRHIFVEYLTYHLSAEWHIIGLIQKFLLYLLTKSVHDEYSGTGSLSLSRAARGTFVGHDEHRRAYRILPDGASHYIVARGVVFDEVPIICHMLS